MDPSYIYFKEIKIDQDKTFTTSLSKDNDIEKVAFNKENEYGVTGLNINSVLPDEKILKIENFKEQEKITQEIQELIKQNKEPNLTFVISHLETKSIEIHFVKKKWIRITKKKLTSFNTSTKKNEDFLFYDYIRHLKKFGFEWSKYGFKYEMKIDSSDSTKIIKKLTLERKYSTFIQTDESKIWNMSNWNTNSPQTSRISFLR